jgi:hypothetical protein
MTVFSGISKEFMDEFNAIEIDENEVYDDKFFEDFNFQPK